MKMCTKCKDNKDFNKFGIRKDSKDGCHSWCKSCVNSHSKSMNFKPKLNIIKQCNTCSTNKHSSDFYLDKRHSDGLRSECKKCSIIKRDEGNYKSKYNLSIEEYEFILTAQNNCCKICSSTVPGVRINRFHVDHCHKTNVVRGLLCEKCNMALGHLRDDPALLRKAADYLENNLNKKIGN